MVLVYVLKMVLQILLSSYIRRGLWGPSVLVRDSIRDRRETYYSVWPTVRVQPARETIQGWESYFLCVDACVVLCARGKSTT